jgi:hypothetical protein
MAMNARQFALLALATSCLACTRQETVREIDWAKAALARNPDFEIVATDETAGVFTVRDTATGTMRTLKLQELVAAPAAGKTPSSAAPADTAAPAAESPGQPTVESPDVPEDGDALAAGQTTDAVDQVMAQRPAGAPLAEGPGYSISRGTDSKPEVATATLEGPGYRIEKQGEESGRNESVPTAQSSSVERRTDPIICQGNRLMRIDGETIEFSGDAVIAEKGCDLYISNAHIRAGGVGIIARQARVHIVNSVIGGTRGSYEASAGGEIYVASSTFNGVGRRFDGGQMTDLGGNSYESQ